MQALQPDILLQHVQDLLEVAKKLNKKAAEQNRVTGEKFNLIEILGVAYLEVSTHSSLLAELLNPKGCHGQGMAFLELFLKELSLEFIATEQVRVTTEHFIGTTTETTGGRIDILIEDPKNRWMLVIENKVYAKDQPNQMLRYNNFAKEFEKKGGKYSLVYLTRFGGKPDSSEIRPNALLCISYLCISYKTHILKWISQCRERVDNVPLLRETLTIYLNTLMTLTDQNPNQRISQDLVKAVLKSRESFLSYTALTQAEAEIKQAIQERLSWEFIAIAKSMTMDYIPDKDWSATDSGFGFSSNAMKHLGVTAKFEFELKSFQNFYFGFRVEDNKELEIGYRNKLFTKFHCVFGEPSSTPKWPAWRYVEGPLRNWNNETIASIYFAEDAQELFPEVKQILKGLQDIAVELHAGS